MARPEEIARGQAHARRALSRMPENWAKHGNTPRFRKWGLAPDFVQWPLTTARPASCEQSLHRLRPIAVREYVSHQHLVFDPKMVLEHALEHRAQIGCRLQIAVLVEIGLLDARPIGDDPPILERTARRTAPLLRYRDRFRHCR